MAEATRHRSDSPTKTCTQDGCDRPLRARGFCVTHYNAMRGKDWAYPKVECQCGQCGETVFKPKTSRYANRFCSWSCRDEWQRWNKAPLACVVPETHPSRSSRVPDSHPSRVPLSCSVPSNHPSRVVRRAWCAGYCAECGKAYVIASEWVTHSRYCSMTCQRRTRRRARKAREAGASGSFTWSGFMKLTLELGNECAYCGGDNGDRPLDPDHVMPLNRDGHNGLTNILPACRWCNGDKRDLLMDEWAADREARGLPSLRYDVARFPHLTAHAEHYAA